MDALSVKGLRGLPLLHDFNCLNVGHEFVCARGSVGLNCLVSFFLSMGIVAASLVGTHVSTESEQLLLIALFETDIERRGLNRGSTLLMVSLTLSAALSVFEKTKKFGCHLWGNSSGFYKHALGYAHNIPQSVNMDIASDDKRRLSHFSLEGKHRQYPIVNTSTVVDR